MSRIPFIAANWKMNKTVDEAMNFTDYFLPKVKDAANVDIVICAPYTLLVLLGVQLKDTNVDLGAQNMYWEEKGAYTGEIAPDMLTDVGCTYVILGHSERRTLFHESDEGVNCKVQVALQHGLKPIICVGEDLMERENGKTAEKVSRQVRAAFKDIDAKEALSCVVAYEPIWAIGTGKSASPQDANAVIQGIRQHLAALYDDEIAGQIRILYGGSVKPSNIASLMDYEDIDGALVGGASLDGEKFSELIMQK